MKVMFPSLENLEKIKGVASKFEPPWAAKILDEKRIGYAEEQRRKKREGAEHED